MYKIFSSWNKKKFSFAPQRIINFVISSTISFGKRRKISRHLCFHLDDQFAKTYVENSLNKENNYRSQCLLLGCELEIQHKRKIYKALRAKNILILPKYNYLAEQEEPDAENTLPDDIDLTLNCTNPEVLFEKHEESYFKRNDIAKVLLDHEFLNGKKKYLNKCHIFWNFIKLMNFCCLYNYSLNKNDFDLLAKGIEQVFPGETAETYYYYDEDTRHSRGILYNVYLDLRKECYKLGTLSRRKARSSGLAEALKGIWNRDCNVFHNFKQDLFINFVDITADSPFFKEIHDHEGPINDDFIKKWTDPKVFEARKAYFAITPTKEILTAFPCLTWENGLSLVNAETQISQIFIIFNFFRKLCLMIKCFMFFQLLNDFKAEFPEAKEFHQSWKTVATNILDIVRTTSSLKSIEEVKLILSAQPSFFPEVGVQTVEG